MHSGSDWELNLLAVSPWQSFDAAALSAWKGQPADPRVESARGLRYIPLPAFVQPAL
jgi:hypothetical protein